MPWAALLAQPSWRENLEAGGNLIDQENYRQAEARLLAAANESQQGALACNELANLYQILGRYTQAERSYLLAARAWESAYPRDKAGLFRILGNLATLYLNLGQFGKAEKVCQRMLDFTGQTQELAIADQARLLGSLGRIYCFRKKYVEAESAYRQAQTLWEKHAGRENAEVAALLSNLAVLYVETGRWADAIPNLELSIAIWRRTFRPGVGLVPQLATLGAAYTAAGHLTQAEEAFQEALALAAAAPGLVNSSMPALLSSYATLLRKTKRRAEAKQMELRAEAIRRDLALQDAARHTISAGDLQRKK